jgi:hypothetical protein
MSSSNAAASSRLLEIDRTIALGAAGEIAAFVP